MLKRKPRAWRRRAPGLAPSVRWLVRSRLPRLAFLTALGPGLISGFADNDAGGITTYSVVGAQFALSQSIGPQVLAKSFVRVQPYAAPQGRAWEIFNHALLASAPAVPNPEQWSSDPYTISNYDGVTIAALAIVAAGTTDPQDPWRSINGRTHLVAFPSRPMIRVARRR
jgi:hypothetical protein